MRTVAIALLLASGCTAAHESLPVTRSSAPAIESEPQQNPSERNRQLTGPPTGATAIANEAPAAPPATPRAPAAAELARYAWLTPELKVRRLVDVFAPPPGFTRVANADGSFGAFLRGLPLRPEGTPVKSYRGDVLLEAGDPRIAAVAELDVSPSDVQQCADSVLRLHAEWTWSEGDRNSIAYHFLSGELAAWSKYAAGARPAESGNKVTWVQTGKVSSDHATFRKYLDVVFTYASTISVDKKSSAKVARAELRPGDFFILPGGPGHAILILDVASDAAGKQVALLGQGYMPAQDFQVLRDPHSRSVWFSLDADAVDTPFWPVPFPWSSLHRMK